MNQANVVLSHLDPVVVENRQDIRTDRHGVETDAAHGSSLMDQLKNTADFNSGQY